MIGQTIEFWMPGILNDGILEALRHRSSNQYVMCFGSLHYGLSDHLAVDSQIIDLWILDLLNYWMRKVLNLGSAHYRSMGPQDIEVLSLKLLIYASPNHLIITIHTI